MIESTFASPRRSLLLTALSYSEPAELLAHNVVFSSPFAEYHGREDVSHLFRLIARVIQTPSVEGTATDGTWTYTALTGAVEGRDLDAVVRERHDDTGRLQHAVLFLRPYRSLRAAMDAMGRLLAAEPLPSAR
jgi:hypothetical protein